MTNEEMARELEVALNHVSPVMVPGARGRIARVVESLRRRAALEEKPLAVERACPMCGAQTVFTPLGEPLAVVEGWTSKKMLEQSVRQDAPPPIWKGRMDRLGIDTPVTLTMTERSHDA